MTRKKELTFLDLICPCGEPFTQTRINQKYHSLKCCAHYANIRKREAVREQNRKQAEGRVKPKPLMVSGDLVESTCPKCRVKHMAESKWCYCPTHIWLRYHGEQDTVSDGWSRSHRQARS